MGGCLGTSKNHHPSQPIASDQKGGDEAPVRPRPTRPARSRSEAAATACLPPRSPKHYYRRTDDVTTRADDVTTPAVGVDPGRGGDDVMQKGQDDVTPNGVHSSASKGVPLDRDGNATVFPDTTADPADAWVHRPPVDEGKPIRWRKGELIGAGAYGCVYMGLNLESGELLAVKQVLIPSASTTKDKAQEYIKGLEAEVAVLRNLSHPNIVRYLGTAREEEALNIFLEFVPGGSIASLLNKFGCFTEKVIRMYTRQLMTGLSYLHYNHIMHRDIKGANILVDNRGCIKLADFGASRKLADLATMSGHKSMKGTPYWMAPEVIKQTGHGRWVGACVRMFLCLRTCVTELQATGKPFWSELTPFCIPSHPSQPLSLLLPLHCRPADIWSVACTVIEMATGKPPWIKLTHLPSLFTPLNRSLSCSPLLQTGGHLECGVHSHRDGNRQAALERVPLSGLSSLPHSAVQGPAAHPRPSVCGRQGLSAALLSPDEGKEGEGANLTGECHGVRMSRANLMSVTSTAWQPGTFSELSDLSFRSDFNPMEEPSHNDPLGSYVTAARGHGGESSAFTEDEVTGPLREHVGADSASRDENDSVGGTSSGVVGERGEQGEGEGEGRGKERGDEGESGEVEGREKEKGWEGGRASGGREGVERGGEDRVAVMVSRGSAGGEQMRQGQERKDGQQKLPAEGLSGGERLRPVEGVRAAEGLRPLLRPSLPQLDLSLAISHAQGGLGGGQEGPGGLERDGSGVYVEGTPPAAASAAVMCGPGSEAGMAGMAGMALREADGVQAVLQAEQQGEQQAAVSSDSVGRPPSPSLLKQGGVVGAGGVGGLGHNTPGQATVPSRPAGLSPSPRRHRESSPARKKRILKESFVLPRDFQSAISVPGPVSSPSYHSFEGSLSGKAGEGHRVTRTPSHGSEQRSVGSERSESVSRGGEGGSVRLAPTLSPRPPGIVSSKSGSWVNSSEGDFSGRQHPGSFESFGQEGRLGRQGSGVLHRGGRGSASSSRASVGGGGVGGSVVGLGGVGRVLSGGGGVPVGRSGSGGSLFASGVGGGLYPSGGNVLALLHDSTDSFVGQSGDLKRQQWEAELQQELALQRELQQELALQRGA
ncbi:unnamed protein product [Closterium sp. Yama58-4]|nr:unnamed protein product [Closterium sp. Yama58-4]